MKQPTRYLTYLQESSKGQNSETLPPRSLKESLRRSSEQMKKYKQQSTSKVFAMPEIIWKTFSDTVNSETNKTSIKY